MKARALANVLVFSFAVVIAYGCSDDDEKVPSYKPQRGCAALNRADCEADDSCQVIEGSGIRGGELMFVGCRDADVVCEPTPGCGFPSVRVGACRYFSSSCIPVGWRWDAECDSSPDCEVFIVGEGGAGGAGGSGGAP